MAGLFDLFSETAGDKVAFDAQGSRDDQRIFGGR
jgi:hypothetical protein